MNKLSRRGWLGVAGGALGASALAGYQSLPEAASAGAAEPDAGSREVSWSYHHLDPTETAPKVYAIFAGGGCMYALFGGILLGLSEKAGGPFSSFPLHMMKYGAGGVGHWGTLCGALNGAAAAIGLFVPDKNRRDELIAELFSWYESESLPKYQPSGGGKQDDIAATVAQSVLCHVSVSKWCRASGSEVESDQKTERCRRLTVDVSMKTVELLNRHLSLGKTVSEAIAAGPAASNSGAKKPPAKVIGKMQCNTCHLPE